MPKYCPDCGAEIVNNNMCNSCQKVFNDEEIISTQICPICGYDAVYQGKCMNCNNVITNEPNNNTEPQPEPQSQTSKFCMQCGTLINNGEKFCSVCGTPVNQSAQQPQQPQYQPRQPQYQQPRYQPTPQQPQYQPPQYQQPQQQPQYQQPQYQQPQYQQPQYQQPQYQQPQYQQPQYQQPQYQQQQQPLYNNQPYAYAQPKSLLEIVSGKIKIDALIWAIVAGLQYIIGIIYLVLLIDAGGGYGFEYCFVVLAIAGLNTYIAYKDYKYSQEVLVYPVGIVDKYRGTGGLIGSLIYNILFGGIIGVAGTIYGFILRNFIMANERPLIEIQRDFLSKRK